MKCIRRFGSALGLAFLCAATAQAGFLIEVDTDGADDGVLTYSPNFSFGGDTTTASQSAAGAAVGLTGGDSIFGGDGTAMVDTYLFTYDLDVDGDNLALAAGTALNDDGNVASGQAAGGSGLYSVYATWPFTDNISGGITTFTLTDDLNNTLFTTQFDQNGGDGANNGESTGDEWIFLANAQLDSSRTYTLAQTPETNGFVSMRAAGVLIDVAIPEPSTLLLGAMAGVGLLVRRRK